MARNLPDADIIISTPFHPAYVTRGLIEKARAVSAFPACFGCGVKARRTLAYAGARAAMLHISAILILQVMARRCFLLASAHAHKGAF